MNRLRRRILAGASALAMLGMHLAALPPGTFPEIAQRVELTASAAEPNITNCDEFMEYLDENFRYTYNVENNVTSITITGYKGTETDVYMPRPIMASIDGSSAYEGKRIAAIAPDAFAGNTEITSVTLPSSVPEIPDGAFKGCTALEGVKFDNTSNILGTVISASSTEMKRIGDTAFYGCTSLKQIDLGPVGKEYTIGAEAFSGCTSLVSAHIEKVTALGKNCFSGCTALLSVTTSDDKLTEIPENCFYNCTSLSTITLWDHVEKIGASAFRNCRKLQYVDGMWNVREIGDNAFCDCNKLKYLQSTSDDRENGTAYFHLPDALESVGSNAFLHCGAEGTVTIPASVTSIGVGAFCGMGSLNALAMEDESNEKYMTEYGVLYTRPNADGQRAILAWPSKKYMGEYKVPEDIVTIFPYAFSGVDCSRFTIGEGALKTICDRAFENAKFNYFVIDSTEGDPVRFSSRVFENAYIEHFRMYGDAALEYDNSVNANFRNAKIDELYIGENVSKIPDGFFGYCEMDAYMSDAENQANIPVISMLYYNTSHVENVSGGCFAGVEQAEFGKDAGTIPANMFNMPRGGSKLKSVTIPEGVTGIGSGAFRNCPLLTEIDLPDSLTSIGSNAFDQTPIRTLYVPGRVTELGMGAFLNMPELEWIALPDNFGTAWSEIAYCGIGFQGEWPEDVDPVGNTVMIYGVEGSAADAYVNGSPTHSNANAKFTAVTDLSEAAFRYERYGDDDGDTKGTSVYDGDAPMRQFYKYTGSEVTPALYAINDDTGFQDAHVSVYEFNVDPGTALTTISTRNPQDGVGIGYGEFVIYDRGCMTEENGNHAWSRWTTVSEVDCLSDGVDVRYCMYCGKPERVIIKALGHHEWSGWTITKDPTCKAEGEQEHTCLHCGVTETEPIEKAAHTWCAPEDAKTIQPGFGKEGYTCLYCTECGEEGEHLETIPALDTVVKNITVKTPSPTTATLSWDPVNADGVSLHWEREDAPGEYLGSMYVAAEEHTAIITGLQPGVPYTVTFELYQNDDTDASGRRFSGETETAQIMTPYPAIADLTAEPGYGTAALTWTKPDPELVDTVDVCVMPGGSKRAEGMSDEALVNYLETTTDPRILWIDGTQDAACQAGNMKPGKLYTAYVYAHAGTDAKTPVSIVEFTTKELTASGAEAYDVTSSSFTVSWDPLPDGEMKAAAYKGIPEGVDLIRLNALIEELDAEFDTPDEQREYLLANEGEDAAIAYDALNDKENPAAYLEAVPYDTNSAAFTGLEEDTLYTVLLIPAYEKVSADPDHFAQLQVRTDGAPVIRNVSEGSVGWGDFSVKWDAPASEPEELNVSVYQGIPEIIAVEGVSAFDSTAYPDAVRIDSTAIGTDAVFYTASELNPDTLYTIVIESKYDGGKSAFTTCQVRTSSFDLTVTDLKADPITEDGTCTVSFSRPDGKVGVQLFAITDFGDRDVLSLTYAEFEKEFIGTGMMAGAANLYENETSYTFESLTGKEQYAIIAFAVPEMGGSYQQQFVKEGAAVLVDAPAAVTTETTTQTTATMPGTTSTTEAATSTTFPATSATQITTTKAATSTTQTTTMPFTTSTTKAATSITFPTTTTQTTTTAATSTTRATTSTTFPTTSATQTTTTEAATSTTRATTSTTFPATTTTQTTTMPFTTSTTFLTTTNTQTTQTTTMPFTTSTTFLTTTNTQTTQTTTMPLTTSTMKQTTSTTYPVTTNTQTTQTTTMPMTTSTMQQTTTTTFPTTTNTQTTQTTTQPATTSTTNTTTTETTTSRMTTTTETTTTQTETTLTTSFVTSTEQSTTETTTQPTPTETTTDSTSTETSTESTSTETTTDSTSTATSTESTSTETTTDSTPTETSTESTSTETTTETTASTTETTSTDTGTEPAEGLLGDVNDDGEVNSVDASMILVAAALAGLDQDNGLTPEQERRADVDGSGNVNAVDASIVLVYASNAGLGGDVKLEDFIPKTTA